MTTRKKKPQPAKKERSAPARTPRATPAKPAAQKAEAPKRQAKKAPVVAPERAKPKPESSVSKQASRRGRKAVEEDALPLDVLGEIDEDPVLNSSLQLDPQRIADGDAEVHAASDAEDGDVEDSDVDEIGEGGSGSEHEDEFEAETPGDDDPGEPDDGEALGEPDTSELDAQDASDDSESGGLESGPRQDSSLEEDDEGRSAEIEESEDSSETEQAGAAVYELSDFLRPQREDAPIVDVTGPDTPEAVAGDQLDGDTSAADTESFLKCALEAVMFVSDKPLTVRDIAKALQLDRRRAQEILTLLRRDYENRGFRIDEVADGFAFRSHPKIAEYVRAFLEQKPVKLSRAQLETLAIVAYRQPITRPEADEIRGVDCGPVLKGLLERDLIRVIGKKDEPGRPMLYGTTPAFLELFGLKSLEELPTLKEFTELTDESRRHFENEMGEEAPIGLADFGLSNQDDSAAADAAAADDANSSADLATADGESEQSSPTETEANEDHVPEGESDSGDSENREDESDEDESDDDEDESDDDEDDEDDEDESDDDEDDDDKSR